MKDKDSMIPKTPKTKPSFQSPAKSATASASPMQVESNNAPTLIEQPVLKKQKTSDKLNQNVVIDPVTGIMSYNPEAASAARCTAEGKQARDVEQTVPILNVGGVYVMLNLCSSNC